MELLGEGPLRPRKKLVQDPGEKRKGRKRVKTKPVRETTERLFSTPEHPGTEAVLREPEDESRREQVYLRWRRKHKTKRPKHGTI